MSNKVHPLGTSVELTVPAAGSIAVFTKGVAKVYRILGYPNVPDTTALIGTVDNEQTVFGPYASGATIVIEANDDDVFYSIGTDPVTLEALKVLQGTPGVLNATGALTAALMLTKIVTSTTAAAVAGTVPTGTVLDAALSIGVGEYFDWSVINTGGVNAFTVTAAAGHTLEGNAVVAASSSGTFRTRKTAAGTFVTSRL